MTNGDCKSHRIACSQDDKAAGSVFGGEAFVEFALVVFVGALNDDLVEFGDLWFRLLSFGARSALSLVSGHGRSLGWR
jgi:hypothetical protein